MSLPDFILTCLGTLDDFAALKAKAASTTGGLFVLDEDFSQLEEDDRMADAFEASYDLITQTMTDEDWERIDEHTSVAYFIAKTVPDESRVDTMKEALALIGALIDAELVTAVKCDSSGIAHGLEEWRRIADVAETATGDELRRLLYHAWVRKPLEDDDCFYSCGMHLFGARDFIAREEEDVVVDLLDRAFATAELGEKFGLVLKIPVIDVDFYPSDHPYHNKYGYYEVISPPVEP